MEDFPTAAAAQLAANFKTLRRASEEKYLLGTSPNGSSMINFEATWSLTKTSLRCSKAKVGLRGNLTFFTTAGIF